MPLLKEIPFSDLIISDGRGTLKGVPRAGRKLVQVDEKITDVRTIEEIARLPDMLNERVSGQYPLPAIRFSFGGIVFRACYADDVNGRTWFLRRIADKIPTMEELRIPFHIMKYLLAPENCRGLVLFSGAQASGKTTLAASLIATRLTKFGGHCVTFESPAEMPLHSEFGDFGRCIQTEIDDEDELPKRIMRAHTYASPDIIFIGEIKTPVSAVESLRVSLGSNRQMVVATLHGITLEAALTRLLNWAGEVDGANAALNLSQSLSSVIHMALTEDERGKIFKIPQFLLIPYSGDFNISIRNKLREGQINSLGNEIASQKGLIARYGIESLLREGGSIS
jgi:twitching motility protein PilT